MNKLGICIGTLDKLSAFMLYAAIFHDISVVLHHMSVNHDIQLQDLQLYNITCDGDTLSQLLANQHQLHHKLTLQKIQLRNGNMASILDSINASLAILGCACTHIGNATGHIKHIIPHLQDLDLTETGLIEDDIVTLGEMLPEATKLSALFLDDNNVGKAVTKLACVIPQLKELWLTESHLDEDDILTLSEMLPEATNLSSLGLNNNNVGKAGIRLAESLRSCSKLTRLILDNTGLTDESVNALAGSFCYLSNLELFSLHDNATRNKGLDAVFHHLHHLPSLTAFFISATIDSQCSDLVKDCLTAIGEEIPHETGRVGVYDLNASKISSICNAASKYL